MDLALELGMTVGELRARMTVQEFAGWLVYARRRLLPTRRIEHYLAQLAQIAVGHGSKLGDFLLARDEPADPVKPEATAAAVSLASMAGVRVVRVT